MSLEYYITLEKSKSKEKVLLTSMYNWIVNLQAMYRVKIQLKLGSSINFVKSQTLTKFNAAKGGKRLPFIIVAFFSRQMCRILKN